MGRQLGSGIFGSRPQSVPPALGSAHAWVRYREALLLKPVEVRHSEVRNPLRCCEYDKLQWSGAIAERLPSRIFPDRNFDSRIRNTGIDLFLNSR